MALDSIKSGVSDYKNKKKDYKKQRQELDLEIEKTDNLLEESIGIDDSILGEFKKVRSSFDMHEAELFDLNDELENEKSNLKKDIRKENSKLNRIQEKLDKLSGKKYTSGLEKVNNRCNELKTQLDSLLEEIDDEDDLESIQRTSDVSHRIVKKDGDYYRLDDNGDVHMKRGEDNEYHVLPNTKYVVNGYTYQTDDNGRIIHASGNLRVKEGNRASLNAKVSDMKDGDQRGHIIADIFDGSNQNDNLVAQLSSINQGAYKSLETSIVSMIDSGHNVYGDYSISYGDDSKRPSAITVNYSVDQGTPFSQIDTFSKLGLEDLDTYSNYEKDIETLRSLGHKVECNYSVVFSNDSKKCWVFVESVVDDGIPVTTQFL